jgi:NTP pyrophosphatase (non-canonical NTP hydrolase)
MTKKTITSMQELIELVEQWHIDRNLIDGATDKDQVMKLIQEVGELSDNVCKGKDVADDIGDIMVVLINIANETDYLWNTVLRSHITTSKTERGVW